MNRTAAIVVFLFSATALAQPKSYSGLGAESVSKEDVARFAPKPLEPAVSRRIQAMLDVRGAEPGVITSRGDRMYYATRVTNATQVWRQDGAMKFPIQMTGGEDKTSVVGIAHDDSFVVVTRDVGGEENPGLYLMKPAGGALELVQHAKKVQTFFEFVSDDDKSIYFRANDVDPASFAIYRFDIATKQRERVFDTPGLWQINDQRGDTWLLKKLNGTQDHELFLFEPKTKKLTPLLGQNESEEYDAKLGAKPGQVLVRTNKLGNFFRLYALDAGKLVPITPEIQHDIEAFSIDEKRQRIYYRVNEHGYQRAHILDAKTLRPLPLPKLPAADNTSVSGVSLNGRFVQFTVESAALLPQTLTYDWQTKKLVAWRVPMAPEIDTTKFAPASLEYYPARDGTKIPMFVRRPTKCAAPCPVIVSFHGGPEGQSRATFSGAAQLFVEAGFVYVQPNVRGSTGYGKAWKQADDGPKRLDVITDIEDVSKHIRTSWAAGGKAPKIGVMGGSYGGYSTLMAMTYFAGAYDAGVQSVGIANFQTFLANTAAYRRTLRASEYGDPVKDKDALAKLSPITYISRIKAPLLSIQGVNDPRVPVGEAMQIYRELERRRIPGGLILFADEGHGAAKRDSQALQTGHTIAFFTQHLLGR
ncbi:MAG: prolyl oligopeptidase family serine peptidase [Myxococcota bacterium]|nr:prolyl oligopeptidase family serine peptidase [Myxococcota bacterium]